MSALNGNYKQIYKFKCEKCNTEFTDVFHQVYKCKCPVCNPHISGSSTAEQSIFEYINDYCSAIANCRNKLNGKEIDVFVPDKNIGFEFNGLYWHSELAGKDKHYHVDKTNLCLGQGIKLIQIFEDEWLYKKQIVKSRIKAILGLTPYKIQARKCTVKEIDIKLANKFIDKYHIQGAAKSSVNIGLFYKNRLCAVMTFGKSRFNKKYDWEMHRYCTLSNFNVIGGAGKLLNYFRKNYQGSIITYADKRWSDGNLYKQLGFNELKDSPPAYWYVYGNKRFNRLNFQKHKLKNLFDDYDENKTEEEIMHSNGYYKIWDCGNKVYIKN